MAIGRPTIYSPEIANEICRTIATTSMGLKRLCALNPSWPDRSTILQWRIDNQSFSDQYIKAKVDQIEALIDECLDIADNTDNDTLIRENKDGSEYEVCNSEWINRSRIRIDTRKWLACKLAPKLYGDKQQNEHSVSQSVMQNIIDQL